MSNQDLDDFGCGYMVFLTIPEKVTPAIANLEALAARVGFPLSHVPKAKSPRNAWETVTNLGKKGVKVAVNEAKQSDVWFEYNVMPSARIKHEIVSARQPILRRSLQEVRYIPFAQNDGGFGKEKYLGISKSAMLEFDCATNTQSYYFFDQSKSWVDRDELENLIQNLFAKVQNLIGNCTADDIRLGVREFLEGCHRVSLTNGAAYYIPEQPCMYDQLKAMREYVRGLQTLVPTETPTAYVLRIGANDSQVQADIAEASVQDVQERLLALRRAANELAKAEVKDDKSYEKQAARLMNDLLSVKELVSLLKSSLKEDLEVLDMLYQPAYNAVVNVQ